MYYPLLTRRKSYSAKTDGSHYADYHHYLAEISEDCQHRCVYCDALKSEHANEGFHLDHFRPVALFAALSKDPNNLLLSCAKCNVLKSKNWPTKCHESHDGHVGFLDPFTDKLSEYFIVDEFGRLIAKQGVASFMSELLNLNRESRIQLRRRRQLKARIVKINEAIESKLQELLKYMKSEEFDKILAQEKLSYILGIKEKFNQSLVAFLQ
ncbi:TPA: HNH endonuclease [Pseudomonas aeruginosa]|jgi:hypothetical protein|nr:hypothetical protein [Pseudomonas aeruginosa]HCE9913487.1 HNH endonuclease [Pseudomonas aeruginosa]HCW0470243.1 HNH endonuclease [Pseudomonas aeruginosa]HCW0939378.1 HNH endonuclease [Pseudomonas aeruginosa]